MGINSVTEVGEKLLRSVVESTTDAIVCVDEAQNIVVFNAAAERVFRCPAAAALGQPLDRFIPQRYREQHRYHVENFGRTGVTSRSMDSPGVLNGLRTDGEEFPMEASISRLTVAGRRFFAVILRDTSGRRRAPDLGLHSPKPQAAHGRSTRIIYVDDTEMVVRAAILSLTCRGYRVSGYADAAQALADFRARPLDFDAVVTDLVMTGLSGLEFARELLALRPQMPILLTSGSAHREDETAARLIGIRKVIQKPYTLDELCRSLEEALGSFEG